MKKSIFSILCAAVLAFTCLLGGCKSNFEVKDTLANGKGEKVKVILLAGQSNASGCSQDAYLQQKTSPEKYAEYQAGYDNIYINYYVSGANESKAFVKCGAKQGELNGHFGPELGMAEKLNALYPNEKFFIIKYAWGGTDLFQQWLSPSSDGKTGDLYNAFIEYVKVSMRYLRRKNYDAEIVGMCWMQGESDSFSVEHGTQYEVHLTNFINDMRKDLAKYGREIPFVDAYIADNPIYWVYCDLVNESKRKVNETVSRTALVDTIAQGLTCSEEPADNPDLAHYDSLSQLKLGNLFIEELVKFF
ncbi:MAG: hypothetical protein IKB20_04000 [Clostridia bacterium]|nr:hypothetical protein [Clostridia bacterium]